jgi:sigma-54 specific flagellar transcriptional regulator A
MGHRTILVGQPQLLEERARQLRAAGQVVELVSDIEGARRRLSEQTAEVLAVHSGLLSDGGAGLMQWALAAGRARLTMAFGGREGAAIETSMNELIATAGTCDEDQATNATSDGEDRAYWRAEYAANLIGDSPELLSLIDMMRNVADTDCPVLLTGESGTGKELVARALHDASPRKNKYFVALNCAAIPESLIEAELFGHEKGAFTGAHVAREGRFVIADGGTLFLDEIGDMPFMLQAKLLRVLQERVVTPIGEVNPRHVDVRVIAATHQDLEALVEAGKFRADLYYRLNVIPLRLPPLRERLSDIPMLIRHFLRHANQRLGRHVDGVDAQAEKQMQAHAWPGNIRELSNLVERLVVLKGKGTITALDLAPHLPGARRAYGTPPTGYPIVSPPSLAPGPGPASPAGLDEATTLAGGARRKAEGNLDLRTAQEDLERQLIQEALARTHGNRTEAAALLGLNRTTLVEKLRKIA